MQTSSIAIQLTLFALTVATLSNFALAKKAGQSVKIQYGVVTASKQVELSSSSVGKGVLIGGTIGLLSSRRGPSRKKRTRNVLVGAAVGGAIASSGSSDTGILYDVKVGNGLVQVVTDQTEIRLDDCVAVEQAGDTTNLRRVSDDYCKQENAAGVMSVAGKADEEAGECLAVKQELVNADTKEKLELAQIKIKLLCND